MEIIEQQHEVLNQQEHSRILADFENVCARAGVQGRFLRHSMTTFCGPHEIEWVRKFHQHQKQGTPGLVLHGIDRPDTRCQAIAAALVRNYLDARVIPVYSLLDQAQDGDLPSPTILLVPNLYLKATKNSLPPWKVQHLYDLLLARSTQGKASVVYVEDMKALEAAYGRPFHDFLNGFRVVTDLIQPIEQAG